MRVVVDTNILVSAIINPDRAPGLIVEKILAWKITVLYDDRIVAEYREVLMRRAMGFDIADVNRILDGILDSGEYVSGQRLDVELPDQTDLPFLEVATAGFADALITGKAKHFKPRRGRHNMNIVSPAEFVGRPN
jgi:putative PIN family toxin of toxin-antitoxin system